MPVPIAIWFILTAVVALGAGAAVGAAAADNSEELDKSETKAAKATAEAHKAADNVKQAAAKFREYGRFEEFLIALVAVGFGVAYADGKIAEPEEQAIEEFLLGVTRSALPKRVKDQIKQLRERPPTFNETREYLRRVEVYPAFDPDIIDDIIEITMKADGEVHPKEIAYLKAWQDYRKKSV